MFKNLSELYYKTNVAIFCCAVTYIVEKGTERVMNLTDEDIQSVKGNGLMTAEYCQTIMRTGRDIANTLDSPTELIQFCDAMGLFETSFYTNGECSDRGTLEKAVKKLVNCKLCGESVKLDSLQDFADYLDMELEELTSIIEV